MKKMIFVFAVIAMMFVGCADLLTTDYANNQLIGTWIPNHFGPVSMTFNDDGTASHSAPDGVFTGTWNTDNNNIFVDWNGLPDISGTYSITGTILTISSSSSTTTWVRN